MIYTHLKCITWENQAFHELDFSWPSSNHIFTYSEPFLFSGYLRVGRQLMHFGYVFTRERQSLPKLYTKMYSSPGTHSSQWITEEKEPNLYFCLNVKLLVSSHTNKFSHLKIWLNLMNFKLLIHHLTNAFNLRKGNLKSALTFDTKREIPDLNHGGNKYAFQ